MPKDLLAKLRAKYLGVRGEGLPGRCKGGGCKRHHADEPVEEEPPEEEEVAEEESEEEPPADDGVAGDEAAEMVDAAEEDELQLELGEMREFYRWSEEDQMYFYITLPGGAWLQRTRGVASDCCRFYPRGGDPRAWCLFPN